MGLATRWLSGMSAQPKTSSGHARREHRQLGGRNEGLPGIADNVCFSGRADQHRRICDSSMERQNGVWTADRPPASNWNPPQLLIPGASNPIFVMNSLGDAAIAWTVGGGTRSTSGSVMVVRRPAGSAWMAQQTVTSGVDLSADHAGIGRNGAVIVTWETFTAVCHSIWLLAEQLRSACRSAKYGYQFLGGLGPADGARLIAHAARVAMDSTGGSILVAFSSFRRIYFCHPGQLRWRVEPVQHRRKSSGFDDY